ncbi:hypothetical protein N7532_012114 [Penicillium argentinense]|uniref:Uncharacterized protein n=1 Tax=Penicillium argentinense TaxID=1131581 RepID=A0A9W9JVN3_9EURO|nr:uncharacterized protein N7532_012114 [Penicillium argentinense]KAJ5083071.1 hypothetical protein N7532_012114 [Penicillium argentinense]
MRFEVISALFATVALSLPHGGVQQHHQDMEQQATSSMSMPTSSMTMPMKRSTSLSETTPTSSMTMPMKRSTSSSEATPTSSASTRLDKPTAKPMRAENMIMIDVFHVWFGMARRSWTFLDFPEGTQSGHIMRLSMKRYTSDANVYFFYAVLNATLEAE